MQASMSYVKSKYPCAEANIECETKEIAALDKTGSVNDRWVVYADSAPESAILGEGSSILTALRNAADNLRATLS